MIEVLHGLPAIGDPPLHYHGGRPTPWREGYVVRFESGGRNIVGNFQAGTGLFAAAEFWNAAGRLIVVARGALYLITAERPHDYVSGPTALSGYWLTPDQQRLLAADQTDLWCYAADGSLAWVRRAIAIDGIELVALGNAVVAGRACMEPPEAWRSFRVRSSDGADA